MTIRARVGWAAAVAILGSLPWAGCVGDDPATNGASGGDASGPGSVGQACFPNGTCDEGLTCVSNVCVAVGGDGGSSDGATSSDGAIKGDGGTGGTDSGIGPGAGAYGCGSASFTGNASGAGVISAPHVTAYNQTGPFTVEAWIYPTALPSTGIATIMAHELTSNTNRSWSFGLDFNGHIELVTSDDGTALHAAVSAKTVPLNTWSFVVGAFDSHGQTTWVWVDGQNYGKGNPNTMTLNPTNAPLTIGNASDGTTPFTGRIEEARYSTGFLYPIDGTPYAGDERLSANSSTLALFHLDDAAGTKVHDSSSLSNDATVSGDATLGAECAPGVCNWVHLPAGGTIHVPVPSPNVLSPAHSFTLEGWFRSYDASGTVVDHGGAYGLTVTNPSNQVQFQLTCTNGSQTTLTSTQTVITYVWHHWAAVFDAVNEVVTLFIDGVEATSSATGCAASQAQATGLDFVGSVFDVSEVRLSDDVRYDGGVDAGSFAPEKHAVRFANDTDTIALYHFDEDGGIVAHDSTGTFPDGGLNGGFNGTTLPTFAQCQ